MGVDELPGRTNHLVGNDPRRWTTDVRGYARVKYRNIYSGIDVIYYGNQQQLEYDFVVNPEASYRTISLAFEDVDRLRIDGQGNLVMTTAVGELVQHAPVIYQTLANGTRQSVDGGYTIRRARQVGFRVGEYDHRLPLVIDPVLTYSTYYGGSGSDWGVYGLALDRQDNMYIAGETYSADLPIVNGRPPSAGTWVDDAFIAKLNPAGDALVYATYLGGSGSDGIKDLEVDAAGNAYAVGSTSSQDFPTIHALQSTLNGYSDAFVAKLDPTGTIVYSTYLGGREMEAGFGIGVDANGRAYVTGSTSSPDFPTTNALQPTLGSSPAFRTFDGGSTWSGLRAGLNATSTFSLAVDPWNSTTLYAATWPNGLFKSTDAGDTWTSSGAGLPAGGLFAVAVAATWPVTLFAATNAGVYRSTDDGASWTAVAAYEYATALAVDPGTPTTVYAGFAPTSSNYFAVHKSIDGGLTWSNTGFLDTQYFGAVRALTISGPTVYAATEAGVYRSRSGGSWIRVGPMFAAYALVADPLDPSIVYAGTPDGVVRSTSSGDQWSPVMPGQSIDVLAIAPSDSSTLYAGGNFGAVVTNDRGEHWQPTGVHNPPVSAVAVDPHMPATVYAGSSLYNDAFVTVLNADGSAIEYSTYVGGSNSDSGHDITVDARGNVYVVGTTWSADFPGMNGAQPILGGSADLFVMKLLPSGAIAYATYLGGSDFEDYGRIAVDQAGQAHVVGYTVSGDFPVVNAYQPTYAGDGDDFLTKLDASGSNFLYSTFIGGSGYEIEPGVGVAPSGLAFVTAPTGSSDFPLSGGSQGTVAGGIDGFVTAFRSDGQLEYAMLLGGNGIDWPLRLAVDSTGSAVIAGVTSSPDFPVKDAYQPVKAGPPDYYDGFISRIAHTPMGDFTAPTTTIDVTGTTGLSGWYRSGVRVTLSAADAGGSGVAATEYSVNGDAFQAYVEPFTISAQGVTHIQARSTDQAGNRETPGAEASVTIDTSAPTTAIAVTGRAGLSGWYRSTVQITLSAADADGSGILSTEYSVNGGAFQPYTAPFTISAQGATQIQARSTDNAGNLEIPGAMAAVKIDAVAPMLNVASPRSREYLHSDTLIVSFDASDPISTNASGSPSATLDGAPVTTGETISLLTRSLGEHVFAASASDEAGNSSQQSVTFRIVATIDSLITTVNTYAAQRKIDPSTQKSLSAKLNDAKEAFDRHNLAMVRAKLNDVITVVNTESGRSIAVDAANVLVTDTQYVLSAL